MALIPDDKFESNFDKLVPVDTFEPDVGFGDKLKAAFQVENTLGSFIVQKNGLPDKYVDSDYNPLDDITDEEKADKRFMQRAAMADNLAELDALRGQVAMEQDARSKLTGVDGVAMSIVAGIADPVNFIPVGGSAYKTYRAGGSVFRGALSTGAVATGGATLAETALQSTQMERTMGESALNVTGAMILGGLLGSGASFLSKQEFNRVAEDIERSMDLDVPEISQTTKDSVGAEAVYGEVKIKNKAVEKAAKVLGAIDPVARLMTGSQAARKAATRLVESPLEYENAPVKPSVEQRTRGRNMALYGRAVQKHREILSEAKQSGQNLKRVEFNTLVAKEVRNPGSTGNEYAKRAADNWVKEVYDPVYKDMLDLKLIEEGDVSTAARYLNRKWNKEIVAGEFPKFVDTVSRWLSEQDNIIEQGLDADEIRDLASEIGTRIIGTPDGVLRYDQDIASKGSSGKGSGLKAPFKARAFKIDDDLVEGFLDNDIEQLGFAHLRQTLIDIELVREFDGDSIEEALSGKAISKSIEREYAGQMEAAKTQKERTDLQKKMAREQDITTKMIGRLRGTFDLPEGVPSVLRRFNAAARDLNYVRLLGGVVASSIPDVARTVMAEGFIRAFGDGYGTMIRNIAKNKPIKEDLRYFGIGVESITSGRVEALADINDYALGGTKMERGLKAMANTFGKISLMDQWTDMMKMSHALAMQARLSDEFAKGKFDQLERLGIDQPMTERIAEMVKKHSTKDGGATLFNGKNWEDQEAAMNWVFALRKESDRVIIVPGQEKPLFVSTDLGKTLFQFKSFMLSSTQRTILASMQGQDRNALGGLLLMVGMGSLAYIFKQWNADRPINLDLKVLATEGIERSGALGILMEANNTVEKLTSNHVGLRPLLGVSEPASRYASRSNYEAFMGPTYGSLMNTMFATMPALMPQNEWKESDTRAVRRLLPYQNLMYLRRALDSVENEITEATK